MSERRKLADDIYESIDESAVAFSLTPEQMAELDRRMEEHRKNPETAVPYSVAKERWRKIP